VLVSEFHYHLPEELIAQEALADRAGGRMLGLESSTGQCRNLRFREFPELLRGSDLVVFNNTRVFPARLLGCRGGSRARVLGVRNPAVNESLPGRIEVLLTRQVRSEPNEWECLVRPGRKIRVGERLFFGEQGELQAEVIARRDFGERTIRFVPALPGFARGDSRGRVSPHEASEHSHSVGLQSLDSDSPHDGSDDSQFSATHDFFRVLEKIGHVPLPPYIGRGDSAGDRERYQTVYARERGSVAAPTAGLHFTAEILGRMRERGIETCEVTLHVGLGTFQPVRVERVEEHKLHSESYSISADTAEKINRARCEGRRVVAVGTTTVRTLEYAAEQGAGELHAGAGEANMFIYPGFKFQVVGALLTNFHLPESTLLMLVCALGGKENVMRAYEHAVRERYRFYSYGDCMLVE
jgi:S-adenosylmethionine:tRNA ribosyltransferase-isomerase